MNCFSSYSGMRETSNFVNSLTYRYTKPLTLDFSGVGILNYTDLSATTTYSTSAAGLNPNPTTGNTSFAVVEYNNRPLVVSDFSSGPFTFYLKHAASNSSLPPLNFLYPNMVKLNETFAFVNQNFSAQFYSFLSPGTNVPYSISGCASSDLSGVSLSGFFTAPFQEITYRVTAAPSTNLILFNVSGGQMSAALSLATTQIEYVVTVLNSSKFAINGVQLEKITFLPSNRYVFTQTDGNFGTYPIQFSRTPDGPPISASDSQWNLSVDGTTTTLFLNSSFTGVLYYYSTVLPYMGYTPPSITVNTISSSQNQIGRDGIFEFTIFNNTSGPVPFSMVSTVTTGDYLLTAEQLYTSTSSGYSLLNQSVPVGTTTVYCNNRVLIYQTVTCTVDSAASQTAVLAGPAPTINVSTVSSTGSQIGHDSTFYFTIVNNTSAAVSFSMSSTVTTGDYILTAEQLYTSTSSGYYLLDQSVPVGTTTVYCKNQALIYQTVTCTLNSSGLVSKTAVLAGPPPSIIVSEGSSPGSQIGRDSTFQFIILNNTSAAVLFTMSSTVTTGDYILTAEQLYTSSSSGYSLLDQSVPIGTTTVYCQNKTLTYQIVTCTLSTSGSQMAVLSGPPLSITVSPSTVYYNSNFTFSIANTTGPGDISYSLTSSPTLSVTDISLANATPLTNVLVASGVSKTISCWNKTPVAKTVTLSSSTYTASTYLYGPPSLVVSTTSVAYGSGFTFTVENTTAAEIIYTITGSTTQSYLLTNNDLGLTSLTGNAPANQITTISCTNNVTIYQVIKCTLANISFVETTMQGPESLITFNPITPVTYGSSLIITVRNLSAPSITATVTTGGALEVTKADLNISNDTLTVPLYTGGVDSSFTCTNGVTADKKVTCTIFGTSTTRDLSLNAVPLPTDYVLIGKRIQIGGLNFSAAVSYSMECDLLYNSPENNGALSVFSSSRTNFTGDPDYTIKHWESDGDKQIIDGTRKSGATSTNYGKLGADTYMNFKFYSNSTNTTLYINGVNKLQTSSTSGQRNGSVGVTLFFPGKIQGGSLSNIKMRGIKIYRANILVYHLKTNDNGSTFYNAGTSTTITTTLLADTT